MQTSVSDSPRAASAPNTNTNTNTQEEGESERGKPLEPQDLVDGWNEICAPAGFAKVAELSKTRVQKCRARLIEHPKPDFWEKVFPRIRRSSFLRGERAGPNGIHANWKASFDWLIENDTNCIKVFEGKYADGQIAAPRN